MNLFMSIQIHEKSNFSKTWVFELLLFILSTPAERVPNGPYSPRRGETATQRERGRGGIGVLGIVIYEG